MKMFSPSHFQRHFPHNISRTYRKIPILLLKIALKAYIPFASA